MKRRLPMKVRQILFLVIATLGLGAVLVSCELLGFVSIDQRIGHFQDALNNTDRSGAYMNFHPDKTGDYNSLKSSTLTIDSIFPPVNIPFSLSITSETDPSNVLVTVTGGGVFAPLYLNLNMQTTGLGDHRIVSMQTSATGTGGWSTVIQ
jgi:hypothetical protein